MLAPNKPTQSSLPLEIRTTIRISRPATPYSQSKLYTTIASTSGSSPTPLSLLKKPTSRCLPNPQTLLLRVPILVVMSAICKTRNQLPLSNMARDLVTRSIVRRRNSHRVSCLSCIKPKCKDRYCSVPDISQARNHHPLHTLDRFCGKKPVSSLHNSLRARGDLSK
jgi:hypothetical protein